LSPSSAHHSLLLLLQARRVETETRSYIIFAWECLVVAVVSSPLSFAFIAGEAG
jgi:hypothetical protein